MKQVIPNCIEANGLWNIFTGKKKYTVTCGNCGHSYQDKVVFSTTDVASSICPGCNAQNRWSHSTFQALHDAALKRQQGGAG